MWYIIINIMVLKDQKVKEYFRSRPLRKGMTSRKTGPVGYVKRPRRKRSKRQAGKAPGRVKAKGKGKGKRKRATKAKKADKVASDGPRIGTRRSIRNK